VQVFNQRNISILDKSLISNSLLLSRIWHAIRTLCPSSNFFLRVRSIIIFLPRRSFLSVSFQTYRRSRTEGGVGVLDPATQHGVLQLCWLKPLVVLNVSNGPYFSFVTSLLSYIICIFCQVPSVILPLIF
jgi:hypothetical protein